MAPSPVVDIEPKGPDKSTEKCMDGVSLSDKQSMSKSDYGSASKDKSTVDSISGINESGLKSLLEEAISYKNPKDRHGKSPLFQNLLNEVEQNDASKKKLIDQSRGFIDGLKAASVIENGHGTSSDKDFLNNILGGCEKEKKKKRSGKRDGSGSNGSRRSKFTHSLKINHGPQSSSVYNGNVGGANYYHGSSRSLSRSSQLARSQQPFSSRLANTKAAAVLTSSSNIDKPMVTTYNKQPIMTPALAPTTQQKTTELLVPNVPKTNDDIEMKILNAKHDDSVHNYTTHASLEIDGGGSGSHVPGGDAEQCDLNGKCSSSADETPTSFSLSLPQSSVTLMNGNVEKPIESAITYKSLNGLFGNAEDIENANTINEHDEEKQSKRKNRKKTASSADGVADGTSSVDESKTRNSLAEKDDQNMATVTNPTLHSYSLTWNTLPSLYLLSTDPTGRSIYAKESIESKKSGDDSNAHSKDGNSSAFKDRADDRKHKGRKTKQQKPDVKSYLSENIAGHCGDKSISYLLEYIENNRSNGNGPVSSGGQKSPKTKTANGVASKHDKQLKGKACTDEDIRNKKPPKAKERLKKSTSLEDLRHNKTKSSKKQSSVDDSHYTKADNDEAEDIPVMAAATRTQTTAVSSASLASPPVTEPPPSSEFQLPVDDETRLYLDSLIDDDNYTEPEFHLVTKKQRKKKRRSKSRQKAVGESSSSLSHGFLPHNYTDRNEGGGFKRSTRGNENRHRSRRKSVSSVVPSDKISDSDSIHSLPVSSTTPKCKIKKKSTSSGCTPQASYADIAKSPQCQSSMALNGEATSAAAAAKWQVKTFSNASASSSNAPDSAAAGVSFSSASSSNTGDSPDHSDNAELVSSTKRENHVELDDGCDQLLLTSSNNISNNSAGTDSPASVNSADEAKSSNNNVNLNNANNNDDNINSSDVTRIDVTLKRKSKTSNKSSNENDDNNNNSHACCNGKLEKSPVAKDGSSSLNSSSANTNSNGTKAKKSKSKKKALTDELDVVTDGCNTSNGSACSRHDDKSNDLFVEFTLKCTPTAVVTTKCSETQTDLVEVNNNAFCNDVTVEETVILKSNRGSPGGGASAENSATKIDKLSHSSLPVDETGTRVVVLPHDESSENVVSVGFDVNEQLLEDATVVEEKRSAMLKEINERSSKYNVSEVIQYVHKSWNEVMDTLSSTKVADAKTKVQYYIAKQ